MLQNLEPGRPSWETIQNMTWEQVQAQTGRAWKIIRKLLTDQQFDR